MRRVLRPRTAGDPVLDLASNDYLGLARDPRVVEGAVAASRAWGAGSTGSRLVTGSTGTMVRENLIGDNTRYGVYVDSDDMDLADNTIFGNRFGVSHAGSDPLPDDANEFDDNREGDVQQR